MLNISYKMKIDSLDYNKQDTNNSNDNKNFYYIGLSEEIPKGKSKSFSIITEENKNTEMAVFNVDRILYAISNAYIHKGGPLSEGFLDGDIITCP